MTNPDAIKVLLIEDERNELTVVRESLKQTHYTRIECEIVRGYDQAKQSIMDVDYDVCILDERISEKRGIDLISAAALARMDAPIILLSLKDDYELDTYSIRAGAVDFLVIDQITPDLLDRTLRHAIERKRIESSLNSAQQNAAQLAAIVEGSDYAILGKTLDGVIVSWNAGAEALYGYSADEMIGEPMAKLVPPDRPNEIESITRRVARGEKVKTYETVRVGKDGQPIDVSLSVSPMRDKLGNIVGASIIANDIKQRKVAEQQIERQISRVQALRNIDMAITGSLDLRLTLNVLLDQVTTHLQVDSAAVLLLNPTQRLEFAAGRGFRTAGVHKTNLRMGEGAAGRAAHERRIITIHDLVKDEHDFARLSLIKGENFVSYWGAPLITKGRIVGVLELYHRNQMITDGDWTAFLETLAGQAAIAIENASLFNDLQKSNTELQLAYDTTLEGWSKALDLRDRETEGHTLRVTEGTLSLARVMGVSDGDLVQIRRGSLLHDIGKMGIPDSILLKSGSLTEDEWTVMKCHPVYAYELLSPIPFLRGALDIPYCHHERWDGTGYPRGLRSDHIPLSARIFSVVDVWDALMSDRPYRKAWPEDRVREHIARDSGTHFDPAVVRAFLNLIYEA